MIKALKSLIGLAAREDATADELAPSLPQAEAELAAARRAQAAAEAAYKANLLSSDDAGLRQLVEARTDAGVRVDRAEALVAALRERLEAAQAREAEAERVAAYEAASAQAEEAREVLRTMYPALARDIVSILRAVAEAEIAVGRVNADLPAGAARLASVEGSVRDFPGVARKVLGEREVEIWCRPGDPSPRSVDQDRVRIGEGGRGYVQPSYGPCEYLVRRRFIERRVFAALPGNFAYDLATRIELPGLHADDPPFFRAMDSSTQPGGVLTKLAALAAQAGCAASAPPMAETIEHELIGKVDVERERQQCAGLLDRLAGRA